MPPYGRESFFVAHGGWWCGACWISWSFRQVLSKLGREILAFVRCFVGVLTSMYDTLNHIDIDYDYHWPLSISAFIAWCLFFLFPSLSSIYCKGGGSLPFPTLDGEKNVTKTTFSGTDMPNLPGWTKDQWALVYVEAVVLGGFRLRPCTLLGVGMLCPDT